ncbi:MAG: hypothetical protein HC871_11520 [Rhizobiales bacterium]|nr:hypothetical protein [Hyphomicrobiales bacterium]
MGATDQAVLQAVAIDLLNQPPSLSADAPVPASRHVRPALRPGDWP